MNFYPHHIGDFNNSTRHLTRVERSVYRDAIERYYDSESALTTNIDRLEKRLLCQSSEEKEALTTVLDEFFTLTDDGYSNERCDVEIAKYRANSTAKAKAGIASAKARQQKATELQQNRTRVQQSANEIEQSVNEIELTINQEPLTKNQVKSNVGQAATVITKLNESAGTNYQAVDSNLNLVRARIKEGYTVDDILNVIESKCAEWLGTDQEKYLRPATLFGASKFSQYHGQAGKGFGKAKQDWSKLSDQQLIEEFAKRGWSSVGLTTWQLKARLEAGQ